MRIGFFVWEYPPKLVGSASARMSVLTEAVPYPVKRLYVKFRRLLGRRLVLVKIDEGVLLAPKHSVSPSIREHVIEEVDFQHRGIKPLDVVVDVGAHIGFFTLRACRRAKEVIAIEPHPKNYKLLLKNLQSNGVKNCVPLKYALSDHDGTERLWIGEESGLHSLVMRRTRRSLTVETRTLDSLLRKLELDKVDFIKIDVEGSAFKVLEGAKETLERGNVFLSISGHTFEELTKTSKLLSNLGFKQMKVPVSHIYAWKEEN